MAEQALQTVRTPDQSEPAPDGSTVYPLVRTSAASAGIIEVQPGQTSNPVRHRTIEEIWYVLEGTGELWRRNDSGEITVRLEPETCVTIPAGAAFQFQASGTHPLRMLMVTIPPWSGDEEAVPADGPWKSTLQP